MDIKLSNKKILMLVADEYEDLELHYPKYRLIEAGAEVHIAGAAADAVYKGKKGIAATADISFDDVAVEQFTALVIPGGMAPDELRKNPKVLEIIQKFDQQKKLIAFICHAGSLLISAKVIEGIKCTSYASIKDDMLNAGALWEDAEVVEHKHFISSRKPDDLPAYGKAIIKYLGDKHAN